MITRYLELVRFSHTIFALPFALSSMLLAAGGLPGLKISLLIVLAVVFCRNVAMAFNRLVDEKLDAKNPRTRGRHLPAGLLSRRQVILFIILNALLFIGVTAFLNKLTLALSVPTLIIVCSYSLFKRFTWLCHFFLGLAIGISPMGAWLAVSGQFHALPACLGLCLLLWVAGFDIIYATQDYESDRKTGVHSMVKKLGIPASMVLVKICHGVMFAILVFIGMNWNLGFWYFGSLAVIFFLLLYINFFKKSASLESVNQDFFLANAAVSFILLVGTGLSVFAR